MGRFPPRDLVNHDRIIVGLCQLDGMGGSAEDEEIFACPEVRG